MFNFFDAVISFFSSTFDVLQNFIQSLIGAINYIALAIPVSTSVLQYMPGFIGGCGLAVLSIAIVKFTVGR